jgi:hypothetical protein
VKQVTPTCSADGGTLACGADCTQPCPKDQLCTAAIQYCQGDGTCGQNSVPKCPVEGCTDTYDTKACVEWYDILECVKNPDWMNIHCRGACNSCGLPTPAPTPMPTPEITVMPTPLPTPVPTPGPMLTCVKAPGNIAGSMLKASPPPPQHACAWCWHG